MIDEINSTSEVQEQPQNSNQLSINMDGDEVEWLNATFLSLGDNNALHLSYDFTRIEPTTISEVRSGVANGDHNAMLSLISIVARALQTFDVLSPEVRIALADGLIKMMHHLESSRAFSPLTRGKRTARQERHSRTREFTTAMAVEYKRRFKECSLEDAVAAVSEEQSLKDDLVKKRWKRYHKDVKSSLDCISKVYESTGTLHKYNSYKRKKVR